MGLMKGNADEAAAAGAHALFFPHGLGHMMGMDVHDMENIGEDIVGYGLPATSGARSSASITCAWRARSNPAS